MANNKPHTVEAKLKISEGLLQVNRNLDNWQHIKDGEKRIGLEIGRVDRPKTIFLRRVCSQCGKGRWVKNCDADHYVTTLCTSCHLKNRKHEGKDNPCWHGGKRNAKRGYIYLYLPKDDFFYPMVNKGGYVFEHRLVMAKHLGRCLHKWEGVHHKNAVKHDNRIENLQLVVAGKHTGEIQCPYCRKKFSIQ